MLPSIALSVLSLKSLFTVLFRTFVPKREVSGKLSRTYLIPKCKRKKAPFKGKELEETVRVRYCLWFTQLTELKTCQPSQEMRNILLPSFTAQSCISKTSSSHAICHCDMAPNVLSATLVSPEKSYVNLHMVSVLKLANVSHPIRCLKGRRDLLLKEEEIFL